ncbi:hypothetical protein LTR17_026927 [Elasticomyces elasticus]|nr:hypothetical protein LTR17_026927 [Elasticomyces elasticus]
MHGLNDMALAVGDRSAAGCQTSMGIDLSSHVQEMFERIRLDAADDKKGEDSVEEGVSAAVNEAGGEQEEIGEEVGGKEREEG